MWSGRSLPNQSCTGQVLQRSLCNWVKKGVLISHKIALLRTRMRGRVLLYHSTTSSQHRRWSLFLYFPCSQWFLLQRSTVATSLLVNGFFHLPCWWDLWFRGRRSALELCLQSTWHVDVPAPGIHNYITHLNPSLALPSLTPEFSVSQPDFPVLILLALLGPSAVHLIFHACSWTSRIH